MPIILWFSSYDVVDNVSSKVEYTEDVNVDEEPEVSTEEVIIIQEEQQFEPQKVRNEVTKVELPAENIKVQTCAYFRLSIKIIIHRTSSGFVAI